MNTDAVLSAMPSFTNPNNLSIVTGRPPAVHGICGNYLIDPDTGQETMMNDPKWLRAPTIFEAFQKAGAKVAVVTAKDKLRLLLGKGLKFDGTAVCFSSEKADKATLADNGIDRCLRHGRHGGAGSLFGGALRICLRGGREAAQAFNAPDLMYLSTTDYVQHKYAPGSTGRQQLLCDDGQLSRRAGSRRCITVVIVADHGMKDKHLANGEPDVIYLQDVLDANSARENQGDPADHRPLRGASRRAWFLRNGLCLWTADSTG